MGLSRFICRDINGPRDCHIEWIKSERGKHKSYSNGYMWNLEKWYIRPHMQNRSWHSLREQTYGHQGENGDVGWMDEWGDWDGHIYIYIHYIWNR